MPTCRIFFVCLLLLSIPAELHAEPPHRLHTFQRLQLSDQFFSEGATSGDINRDGQSDLIAGPYWYAGPDFTDRKEYYAPHPFGIDGYSDNFFAYTHDFNGDEWPDILVIGFPGKEAFWFANPQGNSGPQGKPGHWKRHLAFDGIDNESPTFQDLTGDGRPELVFHTGGRLGYAEIPSDDPTAAWQFHPISPDRGYEKYNHGLGIGDLNGDGRADLLEKNGWWEQPAKLTDVELADVELTDVEWTFHAVSFSAKGGSQMYAYDFDGDGDNDVVTSKHAHGYGLSWFENTIEGSVRKFVEHPIMGGKPEDNDYGVVFSQLHAIALADIDRDGIDDIVTGKRFWAHKGKDPGGHDPAVSYWFKTVREAGKVRFIPYAIDGNSGVGTQVVVSDLNGDSWPDVIVGNKKGTFALLHHAKQVDHDTWEKAQPKYLQPAVAIVAKKPVIKKTKALQLDEYPHSGLAAEQATEAMILPEGFTAIPFASEPDVKQPIAMTLDDRGRVWIAEAYEYPKRAAEGKGKDRILIFEDTDGDGHFDTRKIFAEGLNLVSGLEVGFGGVWVGAAPKLLFIPDRNGDDVPDGEPEVLLDGWGYQDTHETLNAFIWGPDGWLYGCHGVFTHSRVGKPGTLDEDRVPLNAGIWRYHPTRHEFEVFAHGTSNPWGVDFDDHGQAVATACVIPHLFHIIKGARYHRQAGPHFNKHTYDDIKTIADHVHYLGAWSHAGNGKSDEAGGGHAHAGAMIYQGGAWPDEYRNQVIMNNIHGQRLNADILAPRGSGLVGHHGADFLLTQDRASQMLYFRYGPDGQVYVIDWYDMQACHSADAKLHDRSNGRIYKICFSEPGGEPSAKPDVVTADLSKADLSKRSDLELVEMVLRKNDWFVRHSRRALQERAAKGVLDATARQRLVEIATSHAVETRRLRAVWALHVTGGLDDPLRDQLLADTSPYVRAWTIQLALENSEPDEAFLQRMTQMATDDDSPVVRLYLASAAQHLPLENRWEIVTALASHAEDVTDHNLPLMIWYAAEPLAKADPERALALGLSCGKTIPLVRNFMLRRIGNLDTPASLALMVNALGKSTNDGERVAILSSLQKSLTGQRRIEGPAEWDAVYQKLVTSKNHGVRHQLAGLGVMFGHQPSLQAQRKLVLAKEESAKARRSALNTLLADQDPSLVGTLQKLLHEPVLRDLALSGLAKFDDPSTPDAVLGVYSELPPNERKRALATLASRATYAAPLLEAVTQGNIPKTDLSADLVRQIHNLKDQATSDLLTDIWGNVRTTPAEKTKQIRSLLYLLRTTPVQKIDPELGRAIFAKTCQQCHKLYGTGETIGPDLTGANRSDVNYLLTNVVDPSALIPKEYRTSTVVTDGGRVLTGIITSEDDRSITLRSTTETLVLPKDEIEEQMTNDISMMPENQLQPFAPEEIASLFAYLQGKSQVPMLATKDNASLLFNGRDLTGWQGDLSLWSVEDGEIVGKSPGIKKNSFLVSDMTAADFRLTLEVKLLGNAGNSGVQFRSKVQEDAKSVAGYQADIGAGWWGKLYEEHGRAILWKQSGESHVKSGEWNQYEILAQGTKIQTRINGQLCVDLDDPKGERRGIFALQIHSGEAMEVRFRKLKLEVLKDSR